MLESNKYKVLILPSTFLELFESEKSGFDPNKYELIFNKDWLKSGIDEKYFYKLLPEIDAIISGGQGLTEDQLKIANKLKIISLACSGYESINTPLLTKFGVVLTNTPIPEMAMPVADLSFAFILSLARQIPYYDRLSKRGNFQKGFGELVWGKTLGIIGMGQIGKEVAKRGSGFSMRILTYDIFKDYEFSKQWDIKYVSLDELMSESDYVSINLRLNENTKGIINRDKLMLMKPTSCLINTARMQLVDEEALYQILADGKIYGAAFDFAGDINKDISSKIFNLNNVIATPHLGNRCKETSFAIQDCAIKNVIDVLNKKIPKYLVNKEVYESK